MKSRLSLQLSSLVMLASFPVFAVEPSNNGQVPSTNAPPLVLPTVSLPGSRVSTPVGQVMKLAKSKVPDEVVISFIENSPYTFNLTPENIIYLDGQGINAKQIQAMLMHDRQMREKPTTPPPAPVQAQPLMPPFPDSVAPPTDTSQPPDSSSVEPSAVPDDQAAADAQSAGDFYSSLAPYGNWSSVPGVGTCWQPFCAASDPGWKPYCDQGQWFFSDCGWYWHSYYPWGWAPFHYGRWCQDSKRGWLWCPGSQWAPSWVTWRDCGANIGWAPLPPGSLFSKQRGLTWQGLRVASRFGFSLGPNAFIFVASENFGSWDLRACRLNSTDAARVFPNTSPVNNFASASDGTVLNRGLDVNLVAGDSGNPILRARIKDTSSLQTAGFSSNGALAPGTVNVFRPHFDIPGGKSINAQPSSRESLAIAPNNNTLGQAQPFILNTSPRALPQGQQTGPFQVQIPADAQPSSSESLAIAPENPASGQPQPFTLNTSPGARQAQPSGEPFRFNQQFPKIIPPDSGLPFAPAGTRRAGNGFLQFQPKVRLGAIPRPFFSGSSGSAGKHG